MRRRKRAQVRNVMFFPLGRCRAYVLAAAAKLDACRTDAECKAEWQDITQAHANALWRVGATQEQIDTQLADFACAVTSELVLLAARLG